jgi:hypothetical protein
MVKGSLTRERGGGDDPAETGLPDCYRSSSRISCNYCKVTAPAAQGAVGRAPGSPFHAGQWRQTGTRPIREAPSSSVSASKEAVCVL